MDSVVLKVVAIVTRTGATGEEMLVFDHPLEDGGVAVQLPAGTVEPGESPRNAAIRELLEETSVEGRIEALASVLDEVYEGERRRRWVYRVSPVSSVDETWDSRCDCGVAIVCRWQRVEPSPVHPAQAEWVETYRRWLQRSPADQG